jgi:hypothetical protein
VEALAVAAHDHKAGVGHHGGRVERRVGDDPGGGAVQTLLAVAGPDLAAEREHAHLDQPVVQVGEDDVVPVARDGVIEGDGANGVGVRW